MSSPATAGLSVFCAKPVGVRVLEILTGRNVPVTCVIASDGEAIEQLEAAANDLGATFIVDPDFSGNDFLQTLQAGTPAAALCVSYPKRIPMTVLDMHVRGAFNLHPARLPTYRGCFPTVWPILNGDETADYTLHEMTAGFDEGPVVDRQTVAIDENDTGWSLYLRLVDNLPALLERNIDAILAGKAMSTPQDDSAAAYYPNALPNGGRIDWTWTAEHVARFVRALWHPRFPCATAEIGGETFETLSAQPEAGTTTDPDLPGVACRDGIVRLSAVRYNGQVLNFAGGDPVPAFLHSGAAA
ncbi:MAG: formyltransferase family protein [Rhodospirillales bacterium]